MTKDLRAGDRLTGGRPKPEAVYRKAEDALLTLAGEWRGRFEQVQASAPGQDRTPPVLIVVCDTTAVATHVHRMISGEEAVESSDGSAAGKDDGAPQPKSAGVNADARLGKDDEAPRPKRRGQPQAETRRGAGLSGFPELWNGDGEEVTLRIDSKLLEAAERGDAAATRKDAAEALRRVVATIGRPGEPGARIRCVVSVNMLSEGWDANNVTHILGLRAFRSQLLCEQVVGRGLRRMDYTPDPATGRLTAEYVDVFGVPFSLIPFKGREPGTGPPVEEGPKHEVVALPARRAFEIRFPVVEGYVVSLRRNRVVCDVDSMEWTALDPATTPVAAFVQPQVGYKVGDPASYGGFGFAEVDRQQYYDAVHPQTIAFQIAWEVVHQLLDAGGGARPRSQRAALFPQVLRIVQEYVRKRVRFKTVRPMQATQASHLNFVGLRHGGMGAGGGVPAGTAGRAGRRRLLRAQRPPRIQHPVRALPRAARLRAGLHRAPEERRPRRAGDQGPAARRDRREARGGAALEGGRQPLGASRPVGLPRLPRPAGARRPARGLTPAAGPGQNVRRCACARRPAEPVAAVVWRPLRAPAPPVASC